MAYAGKVGETTPSVRSMRAAPRPVGPVAAGVALGLLIGAGAALLFAPDAGVDTRRRFQRQLRRVRLRGSDAWEDLGLELKHAGRRLERARRRGRLALDDLQPVDD